MSTLYIRLPPKAIADNSAQWHVLACPFALVANGNLSRGGVIERQGAAPISDLSDTMAKAQRVVLLLAASDVVLLRVPVPPLSSAKLKAALPNLVEDQLLADPSDCVVVASESSDGLRTIAVVQRNWLESLASTLAASGARYIAALPAQLCLLRPDQTGSVTAVIEEHDAELEMTLRLSEQDGIGLIVLREPHESAASAALRTLCAVVPEAPVTLHVAQSEVRAYQEAINSDIALSKRINLSADNWSRRIAAVNDTTLDLMSGLGANGPGLDLRPWRWPLALAATVLIVNIAALDIDWWRMRSESSALRANMVQIYKSAYPKESVILDPMAQMQQKIAMAKHDSGLAAPDDFTAATAALGVAWPGIAGTGKSSVIAALEYHQRSLYVRLEPGSEAPTQQMKTVLAKHGLSLALAAPDPASGAPGEVVWQIRSAK